MRTPPLSWLLSLPLLAAQLAGQTPERLTLATVLERGPALAMTPMRVLWQPEGHGASVIMTAPNGGQIMLGYDVTGQFTGETISVDSMRSAIGLEDAPGPQSYPACTWADTRTLRIEQDQAVFHLHLGSGQADKILQWPKPGGDALLAGASFHKVAPGDQHVAYVRDHELWLTDRSAEIHQLTHDGSTDIVYGGAAHRAEFGITSGLFWSDDGRYLAFSREDLRPVAEYPYQDLDREPPAARHGRYPMAGQEHSKVTIGVCDTKNGSITWLEQDPAEDVYWTNIAVRNDGSLYAARVNRGQDHVELCRYELTTGKRVAVLLREHDPEWVEPEHPPTFLADGRFLWWSRRSGFRHLWLCAADGTVQHQVTTGAFDVQSLLAASDEAVWFQAAGEDPRQLHLFRAELDGSGVLQLTERRGTHRAELSADQQFAFVTFASLDSSPRTYHLDLATGKTGLDTRVYDPLREFALPEQRFFEIEANDGSKLYGHLALPPGLPAEERRPVLLYVYGGPHAQLVKDDWLGGAPLWLQAFAAEGYIVCRLDNRGTPNRGIEFEQVIHRRLGTLEVEDQLRAVDWLKQQPFVDADRIAVHGWSFGGYMTLRLMTMAPDTFACGISGAPVTDWSMYETGYTERYMDTPAENAQGYTASSCLPLADKLQRPLLLVHGTDDRTVMWSHTLRFVDRCVQAGTTLSYFPYPMQKHGLRGKHRSHFLRMMHAFLQQHLR